MLGYYYLIFQRKGENMENLLSHLDSLDVVERESKAGKPYYVLSLKFDSGYVFETFLNNEQYFIIAQLL